MTVGLTFGSHRANTRHANEHCAEHAPWCVQHGPTGCEGQVFSLPGTKLHIWLTAPTAGDPRLVVEGPEGLVQLPVEA
jgi:hypothetical protein